MNDRFKFRAWDKGTQQIGQQVDKYITAEDNSEFKTLAFLFPAMGLKTFAECLSDNNFIVMQSTGLKDKNGELIFEGDVVKHDYMGIAVCKWMNAGVEFEMPKNQHGNIHYLSDIKNIEVIGNIYEHSHLLQNNA